jgi:hypothetical protein
MGQGVQEWRRLVSDPLAVSTFDHACCGQARLITIVYLSIFHSPASSVRMQTLYPGNIKGGKYHCTIDLLFDWFGISCMT